MPVRVQVVISIIGGIKNTREDYYPEGTGGIVGSSGELTVEDVDKNILAVYSANAWLSFRVVPA